MGILYLPVLRRFQIHGCLYVDSIRQQVEDQRKIYRLYSKNRRRISLLWIVLKYRMCPSFSVNPIIQEDTIYN